MGDNLPIDIHYNKLLDWLISRRHCKHEWQASVIVIREKINAAIQDMPPVTEITEMLQGTYINYFHCKRIVELLKGTEAGSKNLFGRYSSQRMKDWLEIVKLYQMENVYLAEAAQLLSRNVNYEIPALKRQITRCKQTRVDADRKEKEYIGKAVEHKTNFAASCKEMGIEGNKVKTELVGLIQELPGMFTTIVDSTKNIQRSVNFYEDFQDFTLKNPEFSKASLPLIKFVIQNGNTTVYEYKYDKKPAEVIQPTLTFDLRDEEILDESKTEEIDWGNIDFEVKEEDAIDFGEGEIEIAVAEEGSGEGDIDWGDVPNTESSPPTDADGIAKGPEALTLLDNVYTRNQFIDELLELNGFLEQRVSEMASPDIISSSQFLSAPESLQVESCVIEKMKSTVNDILSQLTNTRMHHLFLIKSSPRYVDRLAEKLRHTMSLSDKMAASQRLMVIKRAEADDEVKVILPKLDVIREKTKDLKRQIEGEVSKKYSNRPVNVMGEVNTI